MPTAFGSRAPKGKAAKGQSKASGRTEKRSQIREYEKLFGADLSEAELNSMIDDAFNSLDIPDSIKGSVKEKLKKKGKGKKKLAVPKKKED